MTDSAAFDRTAFLDTPSDPPAAAPGSVPAADALTPADRYQELFVAVQRSSLFADSKTFVDSAPRHAPDAILAAYRAESPAADFDLAAFVHAHFHVVAPLSSDYVSQPGQALADHIDGLWDVLTRQPQAHPPHSSLLPLPHPYVVPGGRFQELYYWDSYFTMLGLAASGRGTLLCTMVANFAHLIDTYGHVPNGTRTYYLSRSQPPLFALMVSLAAEAGAVDAVHYLPQLRREHAFWMRGADTVDAQTPAAHRVVRLPDGSLLNRYWDARDTPREEAWQEDMDTAQGAGRPAAEVFRDLRAAAESGWDFSSRWLDVHGAAPPDGSPRALGSIRTTAILPVDLNALLYRLEATIAQLLDSAGQPGEARQFAQAAAQRRAAMHTWLWHPERSCFTDFDWQKGQARQLRTAACMVPLFTGVATADQAAATADTVASCLLAEGGMGTTEFRSGQQWDRPNGWAPMQWMAIEGLRRYGHHSLADTITQRWLATVAAVYEREGKLVEKYALRQSGQAHTAGGGGGEYPLQDGFGWTNGVTRRLLADAPGHSACRCRAHDPQPQHG